MNKRALIILLILGIVAFFAIMAPGNYNQLVDLREEVDAQWSQVENVYQRRADLIPNLVNTVKGYADFEQETLNQVVSARASVGKLTVTKEVLEDPALMKKFNAAQGELGGALSRLLVVAENYPNLKASANFSDLMTQLEGTENRITNERRKFNESAKAYNARIKKFPTMLYSGLFGFNEVSYFQATEGSENAPKVEF